MPDFLTICEVARTLRMSRENVARLLRMGYMPGYQVGSGRTANWRIDKTEFEVWLRGRANKALRVGVAG
jgi:excisionase family DNA binding protein